jgi:hypothetical protein
MKGKILITLLIEPKQKQGMEFSSEGSRMMEAILATVSPSQHKILLRKRFQGRLHEMALHPLANHIIQKLISTVNVLNRTCLCY